jgi:hypothetical protein
MEGKAMDKNRKKQQEGTEQILACANAQLGNSNAQYQDVPILNSKMVMEWA